jgi:hypothetical protein
MVLSIKEKIVILEPTPLLLVAIPRHVNSVLEQFVIPKTMDAVLHPVKSLLLVLCVGVREIPLVISPRLVLVITRPVQKINMLKMERVVEMVYLVQVELVQV